ncbi:MAG: hypothetical protein JO279_17320 [Verrucomicrobia bacterium]|nr:hypothetical protein [Verrucomicrobiota bacterium]
MRVAWHAVPGKKEKDAFSPVGTVDQGLLEWHFISDYLAFLKAQDVKFDEKYP